MLIYSQPGTGKTTSMLQMFYQNADIKNLVIVVPLQSLAHKMKTDILSQTKDMKIQVRFYLDNDFASQRFTISGYKQVYIICVESLIKLDDCYLEDFIVYCDEIEQINAQKGLDSDFNINKRIKVYEQFDKLHDQSQYPIYWGDAVCQYSTLIDTMKIFSPYSHGVKVIYNQFNKIRDVTVQIVRPSHVNSIDSKWEMPKLDQIVSTICHEVEKSNLLVSFDSVHLMVDTVSNVAVNCPNKHFYVLKGKDSLCYDSKKSLTNVFYLENRTEFYANPDKFFEDGSVFFSPTITVGLDFNTNIMDGIQSISVFKDHSISKELMYQQMFRNRRAKKIIVMFNPHHSRRSVLKKSFLTYLRGCNIEFYQIEEVKENSGCQQLARELSKMNGLTADIISKHVSGTVYDQIKSGIEKKTKNLQEGVMTYLDGFLQELNVEGAIKTSVKKHFSVRFDGSKFARQVLRLNEDYVQYVEINSGFYYNVGDRQCNEDLIFFFGWYNVQSKNQGGIQCI